MKKLVTILLLAFSPISFAVADVAFSEVPTNIRMEACDGNPRINVLFADATHNIWYPANSGDNSKSFLAIATAAKATSSKMFAYIQGSAVSTSYCIGISGRPVIAFGLD